LTKLRSLRRLMSSSRVVVAHGSGTLRACVLAGAGVSTPVIYRNISDPQFWMSRPSRRARVRVMLSQVDHVVALWQGGADYLQEALGLSGDKVSVVPNAVGSGRYRFPDPKEREVARKLFHLPQAATVVLFAAALQPEKHAETAIHALTELPAQFRLLIVGDGPQIHEVRQLAEEIAPGRVVLAGQLEDMRPVYWASDVIVLPSEGEGLPAVLIEAALCGVPAVASTSGGNADIVLDGVCGRLVAPADHSQLATMVREVAEQREAMGKAAAARCSDMFDFQKVAESWATVLDRVPRPTGRKPV
jgi:glycosyltransferase involved in cell wall biosynthesis